MKNEMRKMINQMKNFGKLKINESMGDVKYASDGGYYTKNNDIIVSKEEANFIKNIIEKFKTNIANPESPVFVDNTAEGIINMKIINDLRNNWYVKFENDSENGVDYFWLSPNQNIEDLNDGLEYAWQLFYDKIV